MHWYDLMSACERKALDFTVQLLDPIAQPHMPQVKELLSEKDTEGKIDKQKTTNQTHHIE